MERDHDGTPIFSDAEDAAAALENPDLSRDDRLGAEAALEAMREGWDAETLAAEPVLHQGQADDCHVEDQSGYRRIWLSRTGEADGEPFENTVTIEGRRDGSWVNVARYDGGELPDEDEDEDEAGWSAELDSERFALAITIGNAAMTTRDDVARALREAADSMQAGVADEGTIRDGNGNTVGRWAYEDEPRRLDGQAFEYRGALTVYAANGDEADELAREVCQWVAEPVLFGTDAHVGGDIAPPALKLPAIHGYQAGDS